MAIQSVAVFCGSRSGNNSLYDQHARHTGVLIAQHQWQLVYGGGNKGLMGAVANAALEAGATVTGVMPEILTAWEHQHNGLTQLHVVKDMHVRKKMMYDLCDAVIVLAGGNGTMDELFEIITWNALSIHDKKIVLLNTAGFYNPLLQHFYHMQQEGFLYDDWKKNLFVCNTPEEAFAQLATGI
jgi:uncharacterized protein (TIGR00730 family)